MQISQPNNLLLLRLQALHAAQKALHILATLDGIEGMLVLAFDVIQLGSVRKWPGNATAGFVQRPVADDGRHPRHRARNLGLEIPGALPDAKISFLDHFFCHLSTAQDTQDDGEKIRRGGLIELCKRRLVTLGDGSEQDLEALPGGLHPF